VTINAVVFDLDGTLVKFKLDYKALRAEAIQHLTQEGFPASIFSLNESIFETLKKAKIYMKNNGEKEQGFSRVKKAIYRIAERYELQAARDTEPQPGVNETLKTLKKMKLKLGLFTINSDQATSYLLQQIRLKKYFDAVVSRDSVEMVKPDPQHLALVLQTLNVRPKGALVVGDSVIDMKSAEELKAIGVGIPTGISTPEALVQAGATYLITSLTDLPTLIHQFNKETKTHHKPRMREKF